MNIFHSKGIALRLFLSFSLSSVLIFVTIMLSNYFYSKDKTERQIGNHVRSIITSSVNKVESVLNGVEKIPENLANVIENKGFTLQELGDLLCSTLRLNDEIYGLSIAFEPYQFKKDLLYAGIYCYREGRGFRLKSFGSDNDRYFYQDWYQMAREMQSPQWSEPYYEEKTLLSTYSVPVYKTRGGKRHLIGIVAVDISLEWFSDIVLSTKVLKTGYGALISQNGTIVTHPDRGLIMNETFFTIAEANKDNAMREIGREVLRKESGIVRHHNLFGMDAYLYYTRIPSNDWRLLMLFPAKEMFQDIRDLNVNVAVLGIVGIILLAITSVVIAKGITKPLRRLSTTAEEIGRGNLDAAIPEVTGRDEVAMLASSFGTMRDSLRQYISKLTETTAAKQRIESELSIAHDIQMNMLKKIFPPFPDRKEIDVFALLEPAKEVGGDFYDFFFLDEDRLLFIVADVSGKGVPASLFMSVTMTLFKAKSSADMSPDVILSMVNNELCDGNDSSMFVTVFCGILNCCTGELIYANGGHMPPVIVRRDQGAQFIDMPDGLIIGVMKDVGYSCERIALLPGDRILCYTDGVTEAMNGNREFYGSERLLEVIKKAGQEDLQGIAALIMEDLVFFADNAPQSDDITLLCIEYRGR